MLIYNFFFLIINLNIKDEAHENGEFDSFYYNFRDECRILLKYAS